MPSPYMSAPFRQYGANVTISASTSSSGGALPRAKEQTAVVQNVGSVVSFVKFGTGAQTAAVTDIPLEPGAKRVLKLAESDTHVAARTASSTATVYVSVGDGSVS